MSLAIRVRRCVRWLAPMLAVLLLAAGASAQGPAQEAAATFAALGCAGCHGAGGRGSALAPAIAGSALDLAQFGAAVRAARGAMPAYDEQILPDGVVAALHAYLGGQPGIARPAGRAGLGAELYERVGCYSCHSNQGQGVLHGPRIAPQPVRWERFRWYVRQPSAQMPPYSEAVLSEQDLADIYAFLETRPAPPPLSDLPLLAP